MSKPLGMDNETLTVWRCRRPGCRTVSDHIGVTIEPCFNCGADRHTWERLSVAVVWSSDRGYAEAACTATQAGQTDQEDLDARR